MGLRFIADSPIIRASLIGVAVINFFNLMFEALFMLYAVRALGVSAGLLGVVIGAGAIGGILGSVLCKWLTSRLGAGLVYVAGCFVFTVPLALVPLASPAHRMLMLLMLFASCFASGFGVMVLDISIAAISGVVIPDTLRSRVSGAYQAINYGTRPAGALLGGLLGTALGPAARAVDRRGRRGARLGPAAAIAAAAVPDAGSAGRSLRFPWRWRRRPHPFGMMGFMRTIALEEHFWTDELAAAPGTGVLARANGAVLDGLLRDVGAARIADMDAAGIDVQVLSHVQPAAQGLPGADGVAAARRANDYLARR